MKVMSYNILTGGNLTHGDRTDHILRTIHEASPDVVGLCECSGFDVEDRARLKEFSAKLNMTPVMNNASSGSHVAILYSNAVDVIDTGTGYYTMCHGFARITVRHAEIGNIAVLMAHLHPYSSWYRVTEAQVLAAYAYHTPAAIIMGDMNTISPSQLPLSPGQRATGLAASQAGPNGEPDPTPVEVLLAHGFVDVGEAAVGATYPTRLHDHSGVDPLTARLDYIFASPRVAERCVSAFAVNTEVAHRASDHLPVVADFALEGSR